MWKTYCSIDIEDLLSFNVAKLIKSTSKTCCLRKTNLNYCCTLFLSKTITLIKVSDLKVRRVIGIHYTLVGIQNNSV